jgi:hypothetical protein
MRLFMLGATVVYGVLAGIAIVTGREDMAGQSRLMVSVALSAWLAPTLATWLMAEAVHAISPRRPLHRRISMPIRRLALGSAAGLLGSVVGVLGMAGLDRTEIPDAAITGLAAALATAVVLLPTSRVRRGACLHCGYSFEGATPAAGGVCVECGASVHVV